MPRLATGITQPAVCWLATSGTLICWHIPSLFAFGMRSGTWHGIERVVPRDSLLFWWPVIRPSPSASSSSEWTTLVVSVSRHIAVRYPLRISCFLRPSGLSDLLFVAATVRSFCSGGSGVCGGVDVDLCDRRLLDRRHNLRAAVTLARERSAVNEPQHRIRSSARRRRRVHGPRRLHNVRQTCHFCTDRAGQGVLAGKDLR